MVMVGYGAAVVMVVRQPCYCGVVAMVVVHGEYRGVVVMVSAVVLLCWRVLQCCCYGSCL